VALTTAQQKRNRVAILTRHHPDSDELVEARRDLAAEKLEAYIRKLVDQAPPLTAEQQDRLTLLLRKAS
jgi:hypothetical protein